MKFIKVLKLVLVSIMLIVMPAAAAYAADAASLDEGLLHFTWGESKSSIETQYTLKEATDSKTIKKSNIVVSSYNAKRIDGTEEIWNGLKISNYILVFANDRLTGIAFTASSKDSLPSAAEVEQPILGAFQDYYQKAPALERTKKPMSEGKSVEYVNAEWKKGTNGKPVDTSLFLMVLSAKNQKTGEPVALGMATIKMIH